MRLGTVDADPSHAPPLTAHLRGALPALDRSVKEPRAFGRPVRIRRYCATLLACTAGLPLLLAAQQPRSPASSTPSTVDWLNLGFEGVSTLRPGAPLGWLVGQGYEVVLDSVAPFAGKRSLRLRPLNAEASPTKIFGVATNIAPADSARGRTVHLRGYIRTEGITTGYAGFWVRTDAADGRMLALENMHAHGVTGTTGWAPYDVTLPVDTGTSRIVFGVLHPGDGTAWFDSLSLSVDGKPLTPWTLGTKGQAWLRRAAIPLTSVDANAPTSDLAPLGRLLGSARVVALGEGTHGTSEFFRMKHRLTRYLATQHGFTVFAIEANMPEARRLNEYVLTGRGDPAALLSGMYFWTWDTREVLDLIEWMRAYNASGAGRMEFWGFDLQTPDVAVDSVRAFVTRVEPAFLPALDSAYQGVRTVIQDRKQGWTMTPAAAGPWHDGAHKVRQYLEANQRRYAAADKDTMEVAWAVQYARIVEQGADMARSANGGSASRDSSMAVNVGWMLQHLPPSTKAVLWAHNGHVQRATGWMGANLATTYGPAFRNVGFAFGDGDYTAIGPRGLTSYPAESPPAGSVEAALRATGLPRLALDLGAAKATPDGAWLAAPHDFRNIGAVAQERAFMPTPVAARYDLLIYLDHTTPTQLTPGGQRSGGR